MKTLLSLLLFLFFGLNGYSQASSSSRFKLKFQFDREVNIENLNIWYTESNGHRLSELECSVDRKSNSILLEGRSDYIVGVSFPVLTFGELKPDDFQARPNGTYYFCPEFVDHFRESKNSFLIVHFQQEFPIVVLQKNSVKDAFDGFKTEAYDDWPRTPDFNFMYRMENIQPLPVSCSGH